MLASDGTVVGGRVSEHWFHAVNQLARHTAWAHEPARLYATYGVALFAGLLLLSWWLARRNGDLRPVAAALWAPLGVLLALWVNQFLIASVAEPRPFAVLPDALVLVHRSADASFPSDHAVMAGAVVAGIALAHRRLALAGGAFALLMAFTRVYVGAHFPLDVAAGLLVGAAIAVASFLVVWPLLRRVLTAMTRTPLRPLLTATSSGSTQRS
ncbi:phosphatase PAP2 family protein [Nocardioides panacihumi]|uniref:Phosphatase PAP2 family protein n=1 Tax=Nocardioides panacihumi TaxID=400774 RepID=A0ABN2RSH8_9ACTN